MSHLINKKVLIGLALIIVFSFSVIVISLQYGVRHEKKDQLKLTPERIDSMTMEEIRDNAVAQMKYDTRFHLFQIIPIIAFIGLIIGIIVYYLLYEQINKQERSLQLNAKIILRFLTSPERKIIKHLIENKGRSNQFELSHLQGLNKFRTHRIINNLEEKGILIKKKIGKVNKIILKKDIYEFLEK